MECWFKKVFSNIVNKVINLGILLKFYCNWKRLLGYFWRWYLNNIIAYFYQVY